MKSVVLAATMAMIVSTVAADSAECRLTADFSKSSGVINPVHGIGQGPARGYDFSLFKILKDAGIPYARLHDVGGWLGNGMLVDIPNIFTDFDADETKPENYTFAYTDAYLKALIDNGVEPYFRLGVTIENWVRQKLPAKRIYPPKDFAKWARICEHVIRHYTEGWANGYQWKIEYWEIWNEPDDYPPRNCMWLGTWQQFCEFFDVTAKHLKACFPHLKIGGYGKCSAHNVTYRLRGERQYEPRNAGEQWDPKSGSDAVPESEQYIHQAFIEFLEYCQAHHTPMDFFSYHGYIGPELVRPHTEYHRALLEKAGYGNVELHLNEWSSGHDWHNPNRPEEFTRQGSVLTEMQNCGVVVGNIYDGRVGPNNYSQIFDLYTMKPTKTLTVFRMFNTLYRLGEAVEVKVGGDFNVPIKERPAGVAPIALYFSPVPGSLRVVAAKKDSAAAVYIVNPTAEPCRLTLDFAHWQLKSVKITDATHDLEAIPLPAEMPALSVLLIEGNVVK